MAGFVYDARAARMTFARAERPTRWFWSNGYAWGAIAQTPGASGELRAQLYIGGGSIRVDEVVIGGQEFRAGPRGTCTEGETYELTPASPMPS